MIATPLILTGYIVGSRLVKQFVVEELNDQLQVRIDVHSIHLNGFSSFPHIGLKAWNIQISESKAHYNKPMLSAGELVAEFNPIRLFKGENVLDKIQLRNGTVSVYLDSTGGGNFEIFKPTPDQNSSESFNLNLKKVELKNFRCIYYDESNKQSTNFFADDLTFSGKFGDEKYDLKVKGTCLFDHLAYEAQSYITGKHAEVDIQLEIDRKINSYHLEKGNVKLDALELSVSGDVLLIDDVPDFDILFEGKNMDIQSLLALLPNELRYEYRDVQSNGKIGLSGVLNGRVTPQSRPDFKMIFKMNDVGVFWPAKNLDVRSIQLNGNLQNDGQSERMSLRVDLSEFRTETTKISGELKVDDLDHPDYEYACKGVIDLHDFEGFVSEDGKDKLYGMALLNLKGRLPYSKEELGSDYEKARIDGDIEIRDLVYTGSQESGIDHLFASGRVQDDIIKGIEARGNVYGNQSSFKGQVNNWQSYLLSNNRLKVRGDLTTTGIDLDQLLTTEEPAVNQEGSAEEVSLDIGIDMEVLVNTDAFKWGHLQTKKMRSELIWSGNRMVLRDARFDAWKGTTDLSLVIAPVHQGYTLNAMARVQNVDITVLFEEFKNFDQSEFSSENLSGLLTSDFDLQMYFDHGFNVIEDSIRCIADLVIEKGRLTDYKTLESLSSFVKLEDLMDVKFDRLENSLEIESGTITIPRMIIRNSAMNLEIGGTHTFENYMDYRMKIKVTEILAGKSGWAKRKKEQQLKDEENGGMSAYLHVYGTPDDIKIKYDAQSASKMIGTEAKKEGKRFIRDVKKEIKGETIQTRKSVRWDE